MSYTLNMQTGEPTTLGYRKFSVTNGLIYGTCDNYSAPVTTVTIQQVPLGVDYKELQRH